MQYKSKAPKPRRASIYISSSYSQWALLSNMPNFCGFWPESFCGSTAIMSNPNLEIKLFLFLTHRAWASTAAAPSWGGGMEGSRTPPARDGAQQRSAEVLEEGMDTLAGSCAPSACTLHARSMGCGDHPWTDRQQGPGEVSAPGVPQGARA